MLQRATHKIRESGGTGRRARLRGVWYTPYGFKSRFSHPEGAHECSFFVYICVRTDYAKDVYKINFGLHCC